MMWKKQLIIGGECRQGVVDVICSKKLPAGTVRLVNVLKHNYKTGQFHTFTDQMYAQGHILKGKER